MAVKPLDAGVAVAGRVAPGDMPALRAAGFVALVNNRPDGEEAGQPAAADLAVAAARAGLSLRDIPVAGGFPPDAIEAMAQAIEAAGGPLLAFCTSGTRSAMLWALARASRGGDPAALITGAAAAGYDLRALVPALGALSSAAPRHP